MSEQKRPLVLLRPVPGDTVVHRLWAGTKLIAVVALAVLMVLYPGWIPILMVTVLLAITVLSARIPRGALPTIPGWIWVLLLLGGVTAAFAGGAPVVVLSAILGRTPSAEEYRSAVDGIDLTKFAPPTSTNPMDTKSVHY